jgi:hypothetical protein
MHIYTQCEPSSEAQSLSLHLCLCISILYLSVSPFHSHRPSHSDGVNLEASVESMVDSGVYDFKPYVHSDCGGDYRGKVGGDLVRWAAHCSFGTILRFHGSDHRPWSYDNHTEDSIRSYITMRYKLIPSLISAGHSATFAAFPIVARCDIFWPEHGSDGASSNHQYMFLNDTLVAPIWDSSKVSECTSAGTVSSVCSTIWDLSKARARNISCCSLY